MTTETSDAIDAIREACANVTRQVDRAYVAACGREGKAPEKFLRLLGESGLSALGIPEEFGGAGGGMTEVTLMLDLLGQAGLFSPRIITGHMAFSTIAHYGSAAQKQRHLPPAAAGTEFFSFALTEVDAGSNSFKIRTRAERQPDGEYVLTGAKAFITGAHEADFLLVVARSTKFDPDTRKSGISLFIVDPKTAGVTATPMDIGVYWPDKSCVVSFDQVRVPAENLVGGEGTGLESLFDCLNPERFMAAGMLLGLADFVLKRAADYARERAPFGAPIGSYESVQHPMAIAKSRIEAARALTMQGTAKLDRGEPCGIEANMAKFLASEALKSAADISASAFGGSFADVTQDLLFFYLNAKLFENAPLNNNIILSFIAQQALGLPKSY